MEHGSVSKLKTRTQRPHEREPLGFDLDASKVRRHDVRHQHLYAVLFHDTVVRRVSSTNVGIDRYLSTARRSIGDANQNKGGPGALVPDILSGLGT